MANTANLSLTTDFNVTPYYDDYNEEKGFHRILYKPGFAVQARELTQMQTILQKQIDRFGRHVFEEGSIVTGGEFQLFSANTETGPMEYVKIRDTDTSGNVVIISRFRDKEVIGATSNVKAYINLVGEGDEANTNTKTIFVSYTLASNLNSSVVRFTNGETLTSNGTGNLRVLAASANGVGSVFRITSGVLFSKGHFIYFPTQEVILDRYNPAPTCRVGFRIGEAIINASSDSSLLDPALEASNYSAPGADRLKLVAELQVKSLNDTQSVPDFVTLFTMKNGFIQESNEFTQYSKISEEWARRTFDESGNYYVNGLEVELREHLDTGTNGGVNSLAAGGDANLISVRVGAGKAYVQGYEIGVANSAYLSTPKSNAYSNVTNQRVGALYGSYATVNEIVGQPIVDTGAQIVLYDDYRRSISNRLFTSGGAAPTGNAIGTAKIAGLEYNNNILGTPAGQADLYLMDIRMFGSNSFSSVKSVYGSTSNPVFFADIVPEPSITTANTSVLYEPFNEPLVYYTGSDYTRAIKNQSNLDSTMYDYLTTLTGVTIASGGSFTVTSPTGNTPYGSSGTLSASQRREIFVSLTSEANVSLGVTASNTGTEITTSSAVFASLNEGDKLEFSGITGQTYVITSIISPTKANIDRVPATPLTTNDVFKAYKIGDYIDLGDNSFFGARTVTAGSGGALTINVNETFVPSAPTGTVTFRATKPVASPTPKVLTLNTYVKVNCGNTTLTTSGPFNLGISDVYRVKKIISKTSSYPTSNTDGTDVTSLFTFDNGQRDTHYDHARIIPISPRPDTERLLVELDYFEPNYTTHRGFFTKESYDVNDVNPSSIQITTAEIPIYKSPSSGKSYDLKNHLDFRPVKVKTAAAATSPGSATIDPSPAANFGPAGGINLIAPSSQLSFDYSYYLPRKDVIHLTKNKEILITRGVPAATPLTPQVSDSDMVLAIMTISPYPSISPYYAKLINRQDIASSVTKVAPKRQTMRELNVLRDRVDNLEYYTSLNLLEKNAIDLIIQDELGNDRFKNGIFVDTFSDHVLGATTDADYRIVVDQEEKSIRPLYSMQSIDYDLLPGFAGVQKNGDLITLSYSEAEYANVFTVNEQITTELSTYKFTGTLTLIPSEDVWIDTITLPPNIVNLNGINLDGIADAQQEGGITTTWNAWQTRVTGYKVYRGPQGSRSQLVGTFTSLIQAEEAADIFRGFVGATIETISTSTRTGTQSFNLVDTDTASIGTRLVKTEVIPYIRPQTLMGIARGLKPFAKFNVFFDNINMNAYVRPITELEFEDVAAVKTWSYQVGDDLIANQNGEIWFRLNLPNTDNLRFTVGEKQVLVTDSSTNTPDFSSSTAETSFFAQGVINTQQDTILSTKQVIPKKITVSQSRTTSTTRFVPGQRWASTTGRGSCLAYVLPIKTPNNEEGIFLTSVEVFCSQKHPTLGVWFEIRECDDGGDITLNQVPMSEKWYKNSQVPISTDGVTNGLKVTFDSPIFLTANKSYAFVIHPEAANPNYYFWVSAIGPKDKNSGVEVTSRAFTGTMFTTNNNTIWKILDKVDLTCRWNRASFMPAGSFELGNKPKEKIFIKDIVGSIEGYGEPISTGDTLTLTNYSGSGGGIANIKANDFIVGAQANSRVIQIMSGPKFTVANTRYISGETITIRDSVSAANKGVAVINILETGKGFLEYYKEGPNNITYMILTSSNGVFKANDTVWDISDDGYAKIDKIGNLRYTTIDFEPAMINFAQAKQTFQMQTCSNTNVLQSYIPVEAGENYEFGAEMAILSRSNELLVPAIGSSGRSNKVLVNMSTGSNYLSPILDISKTQSIIVDNLVNANTVNESNPKGGNLFNKYISKIVTLTEQQDAEDLKVYVTAYRPSGTDVKIWAKVLNGDDSDTMAQRPWIEMEKSFGGDITYSSGANKKDFKEYTFNIPESYLTSPNVGALQYTSSQGIKFTGFKSFQIKIGLLGNETNSAIVPRVADLRAIALQK